MVYNRLATATMRNQMTQAETYISTPNSSNDYTYTYDALGNVQVVYKASGTVGQEAYFFTQDAFGNELSSDANIPISNRTNLLGGATWATARTAGITEHQTAKIQSAFSGLYYFHARWYDPLVGRFVGRAIYRPDEEHPYVFCYNSPLTVGDPTGEKPNYQFYLCDPGEVYREWNEVILPFARSASFMNNTRLTRACGERAHNIAVTVKSANLCCHDVAKVTRKRFAVMPVPVHTVTVLRPRLKYGRIRPWDHIENTVIDDWHTITAFTGVGWLEVYNYGKFMDRYPYFHSILEY
ncbi:MAG: hypothetical protein DIKNOCCD_00716 [bacterium]|nr:hypothetical protein [bacterium]